MKTSWGIFFAGLFLAALPAKAQLYSDSIGEGSITAGAYIDAYYCFDFSQPKNSHRQYAVSSARHNEFTINLAYIEVKYSAPRVRAKVAPALGTYMNANYAGEIGTFRHMLEANAGIRMSKKRSVWLDAGVFSSPYTNENPVSKDHLLYTRALAAEYVPYYISGVRLTYPLTKKATLFLYTINGWQQIQDVNNGKSITTQVEYKTGKWLLNWNVYAGSERNLGSTAYRNRYFSDIFFTYNLTGTLSATGCVYYGIQQRYNGSGLDNLQWWQVNLCARYAFGQRFSLSARYEYFSDPNGTIIIPETGATGFVCSSASLCANLKITPNALIRLETRGYSAAQNLFTGPGGGAVSTSALAIASLAVGF